VERKKTNRKLKAEERERVRDTVQLVQSARETLAEVDDKLVPDRDAIENCFDLANRSLREALNSE
jgi:hypothetical protein